MPKWSSEDLSVVALLVLKLACWILVIYYMKQGLFQQKLAPLYIVVILKHVGLSQEPCVRYLQEIFFETFTMTLLLLMKPFPCLIKDTYLLHTPEQIRRPCLSTYLVYRHPIKAYVRKGRYCSFCTFFADIMVSSAPYWQILSCI